jgi:hypothetical protein
VIFPRLVSRTFCRRAAYLSLFLICHRCSTPHLGVVRRCLPTRLVAMIISVLIASAVIGLLLVLLVQGKWTNMDSWFVAVLASAVMAMVIGQYVDLMRLPVLW